MPGIAGTERLGGPNIPRYRANRMPICMNMVAGFSTLNNLQGDGSEDWSELVRGSDMFFQVSEPTPAIGTGEPDIDDLNNLAGSIAGTFPNATVWARTSGIANLKILASASLHSAITGIAYVYETGFDNMPEFSSDFDVTIANFKTAAQIIRNGGYDAIGEPTGRGLPNRDYVGWNYGRLAKEMDYMIIQSQRNCKHTSESDPLDSFPEAVKQAVSDIEKADVPTDMGRFFLQISLGDDVNSVNASDGFACYEDHLLKLGVSGLNLWHQNSLASQVTTFLTDRKNLIGPLWS